LNPNNTIAAAFRFYRESSSQPTIGVMLLLTGVSGIFETLPILASLPLLRSIFLGQEHIQVMTHALSWQKYGLLLLLLLIFRFLMGYLSQFYNGKVRTELITQSKSVENTSKQERFNYGKKTQALNFLFVGWSQLVPGVLFFFGGLYVMPHFGVLTLIILLLWVFPMRWIKKNQDTTHQNVVSLQSESDEFQPSLSKQWGALKIKAIHWDSINKNAREFIILTTLISALILSQFYVGISGDASLLAIIMVLRGMQQLYTAYIMSQQLSGLRGYFINP